MNELIFRSPAQRPARKREQPVVRISSEAYDLIENVSSKTGLANSYVASEMIKFAAANVRIEYTGESEDNR